MPQRLKEYEALKDKVQEYEQKLLLPYGEAVEPWKTAKAAAAAGINGLRRRAVAGSAGRGGRSATRAAITAAASISTRSLSCARSVPLRKTKPVHRDGRSSANDDKRNAPAIIGCGCSCSG